MLNELIGIGAKVLDRVIPDPEQRQAAKMELLRLQQEGRTKDLEVQMSAIVMEAQSKDPWTSRARPSFLYVMYVMILMSIPMGVIAVISPETATAIAAGMQAWLDAIPSEMWTMFGVGYLGYVGGRSYDKKKRLDAANGTHTRTS